MNVKLVAYVLAGLLVVMGGVYAVGELIFSDDAVSSRVVNTPDVIDDPQEDVRSSVDNEYAKIVEHFNQQDYEQVIRLSNRFLQEYPKNHFTSNVLFKIAESYYRLGDLAEARNGYNGVIKSFPGSQMAKYAQIKLDLLGKVDDSSTMDSFLKLETPESGYQECRDLYKGRDFDKAIEGFEAFLSKYPNSDLAPNAQYWLAECYYGKDDLRRAKREFERVVENYPNSRKVPSANRKILMSSQKLARNDTEDKLKHVYESLYKKYEKRDYKEAISGFKDFIQKYPDSKYVPNAYYWIAECYYAAANYQDGVYNNTLINFKLSQDNFRIVISKFPDNQKADDARIKLKKIERIVFYVIARKAYLAKDYTTAIENFREYVNRYPSTELTANCFYWAGICYFEQEQYDNALAEFEKVRSEYPKHHKAKDALIKINEIKKLRAEGNGNPEELFDSEFVRLEKYYKNGEFANLVVEGERFISNNPNDVNVPKAIFLVGEGYYEQGNFANAIGYYKRILDENLLPKEQEIVQTRYDNCLRNLDGNSTPSQSEEGISPTTNTISDDKAKLNEGVKLCFDGQWNEGINILSSLKGKFTPGSEDQALLFTWIGAYYYNSKDYAKGKYYYSKVDADKLRLKDKDMYYSGFAFSCYRVNDFDLALNLIEQFKQNFNPDNTYYNGLETLKSAIIRRQQGN